MGDRLIAIAEALREGRELDAVSVRSFLGWFGAQRRGWQIVEQIRGKLAEAGLVTVPDFESAWIDNPIKFELRPPAGQEDSADDSSEPEAPLDGGGTIDWVKKDPSYRISKLKAANAGVVLVKPDAPLTEAVHLMMVNDFSQLPVSHNDRDLKGVISWRIIGSKLALKHEGEAVRQIMDQAHEVPVVPIESSIFDAIPRIVRHGYVLVRGEASRITGIVTATDLALQFQSLTEPFLLLGEIENLVRNIIGTRFTLAELAAARDPAEGGREIRSVAQLTFGEYIRLLEHSDRWAKLGIAVDRILFCRDLENVRQIRNDVTHFDPDGITPDSLNLLRNFAQFLKQIDSIGSSKG